MTSVKGGYEKIKAYEHSQKHRQGSQGWSNKVRDEQYEPCRDRDHKKLLRASEKNGSLVSISQRSPKETAIQSRRQHSGQTNLPGRIEIDSRWRERQGIGGGPGAASRAR